MLAQDASTCWLILGQVDEDIKHTGDDLHVGHGAIGTLNKVEKDKKATRAFILYQALAAHFRQTTGDVYESIINYFVRSDLSTIVRDLT